MLISYNMIEVTNENIWYKRKKRKFKFKRFFSFIIIFALIFGLFMYYKNIICRQINDICYDYAYSFSTDAVNKAVLNSLSQGVNYDDLVFIEKNSVGDIVLISTDSYKANLISRELVDGTKLILERKFKEGIPVPILAFTGISIISGYGKQVQFKVLSISSVECDFNSQFKSVGINQTLHSIYVLLNTQAVIEMPLNSKTIECETSVLVSETVLVGKVPEIYLSGKGISN